MKSRVLVVEDNHGQREMLSQCLSRTGYEVWEAENAETAMELTFEQPPDLFLIDLNLPGMNGFSLCSRLIDEPGFSTIPRMLLTGDTSIDTQIECLAKYADDFLTKPIEMQILAARIEALLRRSGMTYSQNRLYLNPSTSLEGQLSGTADYIKSEGGLIGSCDTMMDVFSTLKNFSRSDATVLLLGESGTGKELAARTIHLQSARKNGPFIPVNCGAIPENLLEAELFGHERGAFTGAIARKIGKAELAHGGTLFLDEIGDLPFMLQVKVLRFLEDFKIERVGGTQPIDVDVRVIAATNRDFWKEVQNGKIREDFYYRLAVLTLSLPPLRDRGDDVIIIAKEVFKKFAKESKVPLKGFSPRALRAIKRHPWPGNVRELNNCIRRAIVKTESEWITEKEIELEPLRDTWQSRLFPTLRQARHNLERTLIEKALRNAKGNISRASRELGVSRTALYTLVKKHKIQIHSLLDSANTRQLNSTL